MNTNQLKGGLNPTPVDERDFQLGALITLPKPETLPPSFRFQTLGVKQQKDSDFCSAFASDLASELQEGIQLCPEWGFAISKKMSKDIDTFGQDLRVALKRHVDYGALPLSKAPFTLKDKDSDFLRDWKNWPISDFDLSFPQKKKTFVKITGPYDAYDNIRASIQYFIEEKRAVIVGLIWHWDLADKLLDGTSDQGFGHAVCYIGWEPEGLVLQNSAGVEAGENGQHIITREAVNHYANKYGAYMLVDLSREDVEYNLSHGIKLEDNWFVSTLKALLSWIPLIKNLWK